MILTYANIVCLAKLVCLTIVTINNIYWIQKNSIEICTSFGFEPLHQKMYYSFILSSEFNKSGRKKWQEVFAATAQWIRSAGHPASEGENPHTEVYNQKRVKEV